MWIVCQSKQLGTLWGLVTGQTSCLSVYCLLQPATPLRGLGPRQLTSRKYNAINKTQYSTTLGSFLVEGSGKSRQGQDHAGKRNIMWRRFCHSMLYAIHQSTPCLQVSSLPDAVLTSVQTGYNTIDTSSLLARQTRDSQPLSMANENKKQIMQPHTTLLQQLYGLLLGWRSPKAHTVWSITQYDKGIMVAWFDTEIIYYLSIIGVNECSYKLYVPVQVTLQSEIVWVLDI